ncbi:MAG: SOS response-associated peptidase [Anaerolineales bacterium]
MCGRFTMTASPDQLQQAFPGVAVPAQMTPRYNIAPSQPIAAIANDGRNAVDFFVWGLIPSWAKDPTIGNKMINARAETLAEKPSFRNAYKRRRCLILADGFFEWKQNPDGKGKTPHYITLADHRPFAMAGLWEQWFSSDGSEIKSAAIITTAPNALMSQLHHRMPVILPPEHYALWLDPGERPPADLQPLLVPYPAGGMRAHPVSPLVNSPANDVASVVQPLIAR